MDPNQQFPNQPMPGQPMQGSDPLVQQAYGQAQTAQPMMVAEPQAYEQPMMAAQPEMAQAYEPQAVAQPAGDTGAMMQAEMQAAAEQEAARAQAEREQAQVAEAKAAEAKGKKSSKAMLAGLICAIIVAVAGIGFGVFMMISAQDTEQSYKKQVSNLQSQISQLNAAAAGETITVTVNDEEVQLGPELAENTEDYIYVGEWGIKIKIPEGFNVTGYRYDDVDRYNLGVSGSAVRIWGTTGNTVNDFANVDLNQSGLGNVLRYPKGTQFNIGSAPELLFSDDNWSYYVVAPQAPYSVDEAEQAIETNSITAVQQMLRVLENYSPIK